MANSEDAEDSPGTTTTLTIIEPATEMIVPTMIVVAGERALRDRALIGLVMNGGSPSSTPSRWRRMKARARPSFTIGATTRSRSIKSSGLSCRLPRESTGQ